MLLSLFPTSKAKVSGIGIANKIETKQLQCTRVQTTAKDSEGPRGSAVSSAVSSPAGLGRRPSRDRILALKSTTSGGNSFNDFTENQLIKFRAV